MASIHINRSLRANFARLAAAAALLMTIFGGMVAQAQTTDKLPPPKEVSFQTADGVEIAAVYYSPALGQGKETREAKESIPVLLLHEYGGSGADFKGLAEFLQQQKRFAVLVPDLRGHGGSTMTKGGRELDHKKMPPKMCHGIYAKGGDIDACKGFLMKENNQGRLNIDKLCLVGAGLGATLAMNWAVEDWRWPPVGGVKQGQDVKAIIMLSPPFNERSVNVNVALRFPPSSRSWRSTSRWGTAARRPTMPKRSTSRSISLAAAPRERKSRGAC